MPRKPREPKPPKPSFAERFTERVDTAVGLSRTLVNEPKSFPTEIVKIARVWFRKLWNARGGGLYACGFIVTFVWLELSSLVTQIVITHDLGGWVAGQVLGMVFRFSVQSLLNTITAFLWPAYLLKEFQGYGLVLLAALWFVFPRYVKPHLTRWLLDRDATAETTAVPEAAPAPQDVRDS